MLLEEISSLKEENFEFWIGTLIIDKEIGSPSFLLDLFLLAMNVTSYSLSKLNNAVIFSSLVTLNMFYLYLP